MRGSHFGETCAFDGEGDLWFTGQGGYVGKVAVKTGEVTARAAARVERQQGPHLGQRMEQRQPVHV